MAEVIKSGENPKAAGTWVYLVEGQAPGVTMTSAGNLTVAGNITAGGTITLNSFTSVNSDFFVNGGDATGDVTFTNTSTVAGVGNADLNLVENAAASQAFGVKVNGDADNRLRISAAGDISWGTGAAALDAVLGRSAVGVVAVKTGSLDVATAGQGLQVAEGSNAKQGTAVLIGGSKVVSNTSVTATSRIFLTSQADGGTPGWLRVSARTAGTSFTITSSSGTDTSTVAYEIFEVG